MHSVRSRASVSSHGAGRCCLVCLDEDVEPDDALLYEICDCKATAVHRICLEKLVNSRRRRALPLDTRLRCDVCLHPYAVEHESAFIEPIAQEAAEPVYRQPIVIKSMEAQILAAGLFALSLECITSFSAPRLKFAAFGLLALVLIGYAAHLTAQSRSFRLIVLPDGGDASRPLVCPLSLDDEAFYAQVFVANRHMYATQARARAHDHAGADAPLRSARAQELVLICDVSVAGTRRRGPQTRRPNVAFAPEHAPGGRELGAEMRVPAGAPSLDVPLAERHVASPIPLSHFASTPLLRGDSDDEAMGRMPTPPMVSRARSLATCAALVRAEGAGGQGRRGHARSSHL
ncbi:hypothetical protein KFE25_003096 [Diacronema lutheri]|uniref:RING-CH-type domain-containing protein n=1 Tax=Diacronema lutheri TaxID=2081491 RepID=A0A8J5X1R8_DIALT|nr:hypothetical protein KFE25_003096 [Diacronema lutheri]